MAAPWITSAILVGAIGLAVMGFFLWIYRAKGLTVPIGWDTSRYLWRTALAQSVGIANLQASVPPGIVADPARPAFPVIASTLSALLGVGHFRLAAILPAVMAASIGLAAGAFVSASLRRPAWELSVVALGVGLSAFVVRLMGPETYQDNLFAAAVFMAASVPIVLSVRDRRALLPAAVLLGAGGIIHSAFFAYMALTLVLAAVVYLPGSWRAWRARRETLLDTPSARLGGVLLGGTAFAGAAIYGLHSAGTRSPRLDVSEFGRKLRQDIPKYVFPITLPAAGVGAVSMASASRGGGEQASRTRLVLTLLLSWCGVALAGYLAYRFLHLPLPVHRFLAFALAVPILALLGGIWVARLLERLSRPLAWVAIAAGLAGAAFVSHFLWFRTPVWMDPAKIEDAATAAAFLDASGVPPGRPVVYIIGNDGSSYVALMSHMIRASVPPERIPATYIYVGSPESYLAGRPTDPGTGKANRVSERYLSYMKDTYSRNPVAVILQSYNDDYFGPWVADHPRSVAGPNLAVVRGEVPPSPVAAPETPVAPFSSVGLGLSSAASLAVLAVAGLGWALALLRRWLRPVEAVALSPAVGVAALVLGGILVDRVGVRLSGVPGALTPVAVSLAGWAALALTSRRNEAGVNRPAGSAA